MKSKTISRLIFVFISVNMFWSFGLTTYVGNDLIEIPNFDSKDAGLLFWIFGFGGSLVIVVLGKNWYNSSVKSEELPYV